MEGRTRCFLATLAISTCPQVLAVDAPAEPSTLPNQITIQIPISGLCTGGSCQPLSDFGSGAFIWSDQALTPSLKPDDNTSPLISPLAEIKNRLAQVEEVEPTELAEQSLKQANVQINYLEGEKEATERCKAISLEFYKSVRDFNPLESEDKYVANCLTSIMDQTGVTKQVLDNALPRLGVILIDNGAGPTPYCMALLVDTQKIATAHHCISNPEANINIFSQDGTTHFYFQSFSLGSARQELASGDVVATPDYASRPNIILESDDYVEINLKNVISLPSNSIPLEHSPPEVGQKLLIVGLNQYAIKNYNSDIDALRKALVFDYTATCRVISVERPCVYHACQTAPMDSGAPIFGFDPNRLALIGTHDGQIDPNPPARYACQRPANLPSISGNGLEASITFAPNYGFMTPQVH